MQKILKAAAKSLQRFFTGRRPHVIEYVAIVLCLCMLLTGVTYSWIKRKWTPKIGQTGIRIMASDSLVISLVDGDQHTGEMYELKEFLKLPQNKDIDLKPVSSLSGDTDDFFKLDTSEPGEEYFTHIIHTSNTTQSALNEGFIEVSFTLTSRLLDESTMKCVYLSADSIISPNTNVTEEKRKAYRALRCSLTFTVGTTSVTRIFVPTVEEIEDDDDNNLWEYNWDWEVYARKHSAITNARNADDELCLENAYVDPYYRLECYEDYEDFYDDIDNEYDTYNHCDRALSYIDEDEEIQDLVVNNSQVYIFNDFMGFNTDDDFDYENNCLGIMMPGQDASVTLRIWLEGEDPACDGDIKDSAVDFLIGFECKDVEIPE